MCHFRIIFAFIAFFSQLLILAQEIPNNSFETWSGGEPVDWLTSNLPGYNLVSQSSDSYEGIFSAYLEVMGDMSSSYIPVLQVSGSDSVVGIPITARYTRFSGYYKFTRMGIDFFNIQLFMYSNGILIGTGEAPRVPVDNWTEFEVPINYSTNDIPDMVNITFSISALGGGQGTIGSNGYVDNIALGFVNSIQPINAQPEDFSLSQNYPNPFNPATNIQYSIPERGNIILRVFDFLGNEVACIVNEVQPAGTYRVDFNAQSISSGIYFYKLQMGSFVETKKMILLK